MAAREPVFNLSERLVLVVSGVLAAIWIVTAVLPAGLVYEIDRISVLRPVQDLRGIELISLLLYGLRHVDFGHLLINVVGILWFGTLTLKGARAFSVRRGGGNPQRALVMILAAGILAGAIAQLVWWAAVGVTSQEMVGVSGGVSALLATGVFAHSGRIVMLRFAVIWAAVNLLMVAFPELVGGNEGWPAHIGGYIAGMGIAARSVTPRSAEVGQR